MRYTVSKDYEGFGDWLARRYRDGAIIEDEGHRDPETGAYFAMFGRRVIVDDGYSGVDYTRFETVAEAQSFVDELYAERAPVWDWDGIVAEAGSGYSVSAEGVHVGTFETEDDAVLALARWMVDAGCFPDAFYVNHRGNWHRIDQDVRDLHDEGGTAMRTELAR